MTHDAQLLAMRPDIDVEITGKEEPFQLFRNQTLRPVMKMQNDILVQLYKLYEGSRLEGLTTLDQRKMIDNTMSKNLQLKAMLAGIVIGCFTEDELVFFEAHKQEVIKEIKMLTEQRLKDGLTGKKKYDDLIIE